MRFLLVFLLVLAYFSGVARAVLPDEVLSSPLLEQRARDISRQLRCVVCQNQNIDESTAILARDLRLLVRVRLRAGDSDSQVLAFITERYGDFVLMRPPFKPYTYLLWFSPLLLLALGSMWLWFYYRGQRNRVRDAGVGGSEVEGDKLVAGVEGDGGEQNSFVASRLGRGIIAVGFMGLAFLCAAMVYSYCGNQRVVEQAIQQRADWQALQIRSGQNPADIKAWLEQVQFYMAVEDWLGALQILDEAVRHNRNNIELLLVQARLLRRQNNNTETPASIAILEHILALQKDHPEALWFRALGSLQMGDAVTKTRRYFDKALEAMPDDERLQSLKSDVRGMLEALQQKSQ